MTHGKSVVVPREPTDAMIEAFYHAEGPVGPDRVVSWSIATAMARGNVFRHLDDIFANAFAAMLAAAPAPSSLAGGEDSAFKVATDLHAAYEALIYGLPKYMEAENLTDEESVIREAWIKLDVTAHRLAALSPEAPAREGGEIGAEYDTAAHCLTLAECPPGLFLWNGSLGFKSEYGAMEPDDATNGKHWKVGNRADAYCADSGEYFWGGASTHEDRAKVLVYPIDARTVAMFASHGPDALTPRHEAPASPSERELDLLDAVMRAGGIVKTAAALPDKAAHLSLLTDALNRADAILTEGLNGAPVRHEAPAEGAEETRDRLIEVLKRMDDGVYASLNDQADAVISALILQPKDPAEVGAEVASAARALLDACYKADENSDLSDFVDGMLLTRLDKALRARSSAPEARDEALGNLLAVIHGDGGHRALEVGTKQAALEAEKIVAGLVAAPSADKLRIATDAFDAITDLGRALRSGGPDSSDLNDLSDNLDSAVNIASEALAALKAEGA